MKGKIKMNGQVYIPVRADEATPMLMSATGSSGQISSIAIIKWEKSGGISGSYDWNLMGMKQPGADDSVESINATLQSKLETMYPDEYDRWQFIFTKLPRLCIAFK